MEIQYIPHEQIDIHRWDQCIDTASNSLIYAQSYYLDRVSAQWDALVYGDYEMVMPVCHRKKWGVRYIYQPAFAQQHGIFSQQPITKLFAEAFITELLKHFRYGQIMMNYALPQEINIPEIGLHKKENFIIPLSETENSPRENYHSHFEKSLRRLQKHNLIYRTEEDYPVVIARYASALKPYPNAPKNKDYQAFAKICAELQPQGKLCVRVACNANHEIIAAALLIQDANRLYNMISWNNAEGKQKEANYFLYDKIIEEFEGKIHFLDLEGSDLAGVAQFYQKMNPISQPYYFLHFNRLPFWIRLFKH